MIKRKNTGDFVLKLNQQERNYVRETVEAAKRTPNRYCDSIGALMELMFECGWFEAFGCRLTYGEELGLKKVSMCVVDVSHGMLGNFLQKYFHDLLNGETIIVHMKKAQTTLEKNALQLAMR